MQPHHIVMRYICQALLWSCIVLRYMATARANRYCPRCVYLFIEALSLFRQSKPHFTKIFFQPIRLYRKPRGFAAPLEGIS